MLGLAVATPGAGAALPPSFPRPLLYVTTEWLSVGNDPFDSRSGAVSFVGASADGRRAFFETPLALTGDDTDFGGVDVYERSGGRTTLLSAPPGFGGDHTAVHLAGWTKDGSTQFLETGAALTPEDQDGGKLDVYERASAGFALLSKPTGVSGATDRDISYAGSSPDGSHVILDTFQQLTADDQDGERQDLFDRSGGTTTLVSGPSGPSDANTGMSYGGISDDGGHVVFTTALPLSADDKNASDTDVYDHTGGQTVLVSQPSGGANPGYGATDFDAVSADGSRVVFQTLARLVPEDTDDSFDIYERAGGVTRLVSAPSGVSVPDDRAAPAYFGRATRDGGRIFFSTAEALTPDDTDQGEPDVYVRAGGTTGLVSYGAGFAAYGQMTLAGISPDGRITYLETNAALTPEDKDGGEVDVFRRSGAATTWISRPFGPNDPPDADAAYAGASDDGTRVFFTSKGRYSGEDLDSGRVDTYLRTGDITRLVTGTVAAIQDPDTGDAAARFVSPAGDRVLFDTDQSLAFGDRDNRTDTYGTTITLRPDPPEGGAVPPPDRTRPRIARARLSAARFRVGTRLPTISRSTPTGTVLRFVLSERARVRVTFERVTTGARVHRICLVRTRARRRAPRCARHVGVRGAIAPARSLGAGTRSLRFAGRLSRRLRLRPGSYRLTLVAKDAAGNRSAPARLRFTLVAASRRGARRR